MVGDLNMNPYDAGVLSSEALHAISSRFRAGRQSRIVQGRKRKFFHNPAWKLLAEQPNGVAGSYFHHGSGPNEAFWHLFDQVLVRPALIDRFDGESLRIVTGFGATSLVANEGLPDRQFSDHLPITFEIRNTV
ncbi:MAG: hypothetical protein HY791_13015 [Deltaproteobacteria bacterium]|nr:hypothetical protein [Deltaproteobacteria bacterium]